MQSTEKMNPSEMIISALEADHCMNEQQAMTSERLIELCDYFGLFDEEIIQNALIELIRGNAIGASLDDNEEPIFWLKQPVLH